jgi:VWFA-related protein
VPQRSCSALRLLVLVGGLASLLSATLQSQTPSQSAGPTAAPGKSEPSVFKANARIVVLDVVITGRNHRPVTGLHQQDFLVSEDGKPQTITSFEEHTGVQPENSQALPHLQPNVFTNIPRVKPSDAVTVLLLDSLNTPLTEQNHVRSQVLKYLKKPQPGGRMAIFTLGTQLRLAQGFTDDPALLTAAINNRKNGAGNSPLLQSSAEKGADQEVVAALAEQSADMAAAMQQFLAEQSSTRSDVRVRLTLQAFQQLAHYLGGIPGRKNLVWFSGGFPVTLLPDSGLPNSFGVQRDDQQEVRKTDALLASAQIAIYPVAAEGLATDAQFSAGAEARLTTRSQLTAPQAQAQERNGNHSAMDEIASDTGGAAFYNTNGLSNALERVADHGSYFYTLTYTSTNPATDGRFRKIQVERANAAGYQLAYRRGYYADDAKSVQAAAAKTTPKPAADPLSNYLRPGLPASTQVPITLRVVRGKAPLTAGPAVPTRVGSPAQGGDNPNLEGPLTRYSVDFMVPARGLQFAPAANDHYHVSVEAALVVCDHQGKPLNWMLRQINLNLDAARYTAAQANGVNLFLQIDAPEDAAVLRSGVYDLNSDRAGTLEIPLSTIAGPVATTTSSK